jgi:hypothetical protein
VSISSDELLPGDDAAAPAMTPGARCGFRIPDDEEPEADGLEPGFRQCGG